MTKTRVAALIRGRGAALFAVFLFLPVAQTTVFFALDPTSAQLQPAGIAAVWISTMFGAMWLIEELIREEWDRGAIEVYVVARASERFFLESILVGGAAAFMLGGAAWLNAAVLFNLPLADHAGVLLALTGIFAAATAGLVVVVRQIAMGAGLGAVAAPVLLFVLEAPLVLAGVQGSRMALMGGAAAKWLLLGSFFGILYMLLGVLIVPELLKE